MNDELKRLYDADVWKAEEATRTHTQGPIDVDAAPEWLRAALRRWEQDEQEQPEE